MVLNSNDMKNHLDSIEARFVLGQILSDDLPATAIDLIGRRQESKSLIKLAGSSPNDAQENVELFRRAMIELGRGKFTEESALSHFTKDISEQITAGSISPYEGAKLIWKTSRNIRGDTNAYDTFVYAASEFENRPRDQKRFEKAIVEEAKRWTKKDVG